jgi:MFS family permease
VRYAPEVRAVIVRGAAFVFCASALWALLPLVARTRLGSGPVGYGLLLGALGVGAIAGVLALPHLKRGGTTDLVVAAATLVFAATTAALAFLEEFGLACLVLVLAGGAWVSHLSSLNVAIQTAVPSWVRARALSVYILGFFAALTAGSALSGMLAERLGTERTLLAAAGGMVLGLGATARYRLRSGEGLSLAPSRQWPAPIVHPEPEPDRGPVMVTVRYRVDPQRSADFIAAIAELRRIRLRDGAMQWGLFADASEPSVYVELFLVKSWVEHLRQHERATVADLAIAERVRSFHVGGQAPAVEHLIGERVPG